ncbi:MAG: hypothetical protein IPJ00_12935 [Saprospirales bacterium]|nr:hypothetical protein [Saprospirales bacterium]
MGEIFPTNPQGKIRTTPQYTDAGPMMRQPPRTVTGRKPIPDVYDFEYDDILRPEKTFLTVGGKVRSPYPAWSTTPRTL